MYYTVLYYLSSEQQRRWSDCTDAQADLRLCCSRMTLDTFSHRFNWEKKVVIEADNNEIALSKLFFFFFWVSFDWIHSGWVPEQVYMQWFSVALPELDAIYHTSRHHRNDCLWYEPPHDKTNKMTVCQGRLGLPGHLPSLISLRCVLNG